MNNQQEAFERLHHLKVGALFMKMGTGKTKVALDLVNDTDIDALIYVTPFSLVENVKQEMQKWNFNKECKVVGYETLASSDRKYLELLEYIKDKKLFIVADESIFIKNEETKRFKRLVNIREKCEYALILNGTPIVKNEWDLYNQMYFLSPLIINMSREEFLNTFFKKITYKKRNKPEKSFYKFSEVNAEALKNLIKPYVFEADLIIDVKECEEHISTYFSSDDYKAIKKNFLENYVYNCSSEEIINMFQKLSYIAATDIIKLNDVIKNIKDRRVIVYCNYIKEVEYYTNNIDCYSITGATKIEERYNTIEDFKNDSKPLIITYGVGSYGLNLQFCNEIVYSSITFDYGKMEQSKYRIKRIGQESDIKYTYILADAGINRIILENISNKRNLSELIKIKFEKGEIEKWLKDI